MRALLRRGGVWHRGRGEFRRAGVLQGCLIALAVVAVLLIVAGIWVWFSWRGWAASGVKSMTQQAITQSQLPQDQKDRIIAKVNTVADDFKAGKITMKQMGEVFESLAASPLIPFAMVWGAEEQYIKPSALDEEGKAAAHRNMERFARGVFEKKIKEPAIEEVLDIISITNVSGQRQFKQTLTPEELNQFLEKVKAKADEAQIPDEPFVVDIAGELEKAIDEGLAKAAPPS